MKKTYKNYAFTLAEVLVVMLVIGIIITAGMKVQKAQKNYVNKFMTYSAFTNLKSGIAEVLTEGCTIQDKNLTICQDTSGYIPKFGLGGVRGLCPRLSDKFNFVGGNPACTTNTTSGFSDTNYNFKVTNGIRFYNFGSAPTQNGANYVYTVYLDIDGAARNGILDDDVIKFEISTLGNVIVDAASKAAASTDYITADVRYFDFTGQKYVYPASGLTYRQAICKAKAVPPEISTTYCNAGMNSYDTNAYSALSECNSNTCEIELEKPHFMFF